MKADNPNEVAMNHGSKIKMSPVWWVMLLVLAGVRAFGQPANDLCNSAYVIENPAKWCSEPQQFTTTGATPSGSSIATCFANFGKDVWFRFTAVGTILKITVRGTGRYSEMLHDPEFSLFRGDCDGQISLIGCVRSRNGRGFAALRREDIVPGETYLITVQDAKQRTGRFQLCISNYSPKVLTKRQPADEVYLPELRQKMRPGQEIVLPKVHFDANSAVIKSSFVPVLFEVVRFLKAHPDAVIEVGGHTNSFCDDDYCMKLSARRAQAIAEFLYDKGVRRQQVQTKAYGKTRPLFTSHDAARQARNQRVTIRILTM